MMALSDSWLLRQSNLPFLHHGTVTGSKGAVPFSGPGAGKDMGPGARAMLGAGKLKALADPFMAAAGTRAGWVWPKLCLPLSCSATQACHMAISEYPGFQQDKCAPRRGCYTVELGLMPAN